jgi:ribosome maturation factor RimP
MHDSHAQPLDPIEHETAEDAATETAGADAAVRALEAVIEPVLRTMGYELVLLEWSAAGRHRRLRVYVDTLDPAAGGVTIDDCARLSPILSNALDAAEASDDAESAELRRVLDGPYALEVSSPGLDRPLTKLAHFARFVGERATVRTHGPLGPGSPTPGHGSGGQRTFHGRIAATLVDPDHAGDPRRGTVVLEDDAGVTHRIPLPDIRRAHLVYAHDRGATRGTSRKN